MANLIKIKGGNGTNALGERELAYHEDEKALYIGTGNGNVKLCRAEDIAKVDGKLTAVPVASQEILDADAEIGEVINAFNNLIAALKASGVMKE